MAICRKSLFIGRIFSRSRWGGIEQCGDRGRFRGWLWINALRSKLGFEYDVLPHTCSVQGPEILYDVVGGRASEALEKRGGRTTVCVASSRIDVGQQRRADVQRYEATKTIVSLDKLITWSECSTRYESNSNKSDKTNQSRQR